VGLVTLGMPAAVTVDSHPGRRFAGRVTQIDTRGEYTPRNVQTRAQRADQVFGFKVTLDPDPVLKPGMAADIDLSSGTDPR
jgi:HlyD family secretion protein